MDPSSASFAIIQSFAPVSRPRVLNLNIRLRKPASMIELFRKKTIVKTKTKTGAAGKFATACSLSVFGLLLLQAPLVRSEDKSYDYVLELETSLLKRQFHYPGSTLQDKIVKTEISYYTSEDEDKPKEERDKIKKPYLKLWHHNDKAIGLEHSGDFEVSPNQGFAIKVLHKDDSVNDLEKQAAADAIVRMAIDLYLHQEHLIPVKVPQGSFQRISQVLKDQKGFQPPPPGDPEAAVQSKLSLGLVSEPKPTMYTESLHHF